MKESKNEYILKAFLLKDNKEKLGEEKLEKVMDDISRGINRELTLFAARMGWLLTLNSILFAPVALSFKEGSPSPQMIPILHIICFMGFLLTIILLIPIFFAVCTIDCLKKRQEKIHEFIEKNLPDKQTLNEEESKLWNKWQIFKLQDIDQDIDFDVDFDFKLQKRFSKTHSIGTWTQISIIFIILIAWIVIYCYLNNVPQSKDTTKKVIVKTNYPENIFYVEIEPLHLETSSIDKQ